MADEQAITTLKGRQLNDDDRYLLEIERQAEVTAITRIEETAKVLSGSISAVTGIFVAALELGAVSTAARGDLVWPVSLWCCAIVVCLLVQVPLPLRYAQHAPASIRQALHRTMWRKWLLLIIAVLLFSIGTVSITWLVV